jgi:hypothetical protein
MIYHYTKGYALKSIFTDGFIATEGRRGLSRSQKVTDYVWLTAQSTYPKTALPMIPSIPSSDLGLHLKNKNLTVDYSAICRKTEGLFRFGFSENDYRISRWWFSDERKLMLVNPLWQRMETIARKVGDDVRQFWFATADLALIDYTLERYENGSWAKVLTNSGDEQTDSSKIIIDSLCMNAERWANYYGITQDHFRLVA